jgi:hypothetical protein
MESLNEEIKTEARKCIEVHSHLFTCLYNWATAHTFYKQNIICWSTTAAYYAMMHAVRTLFSLIELCPKLDEVFQGRRSQTKRDRLRKILQSHKDLCLFLKDSNLNNRDRELREICIQCFNRILTRNRWNSFLKSVGETLAIHKEAREKESYEHLVIAHHARKYHYEYDFIKTIFRKSEENMNEFIPTVLKYVLEFYQSESPFRDYHLWHLRDELGWLKETIKQEGLIPSYEMVKFLEKLQELIKGTRKPDDYWKFEDQMDMRFYSAKAMVYKELEKIAEALKKHCL